MARAATRAPRQRGVDHRRQLQETLALRLELAQTVIFLDTPWWLCAIRAFVRGLPKSVGEMPERCVDSITQCLRDEWGGAGMIRRSHRLEPEYERSGILRRLSHTTVHVLRSRWETKAFLDDVRSDGALSTRGEYLGISVSHSL